MCWKCGEDYRGENFRGTEHVCPKRKRFKGLPEWLSWTLDRFIIVLCWIFFFFYGSLLLFLVFVVSAVWPVISFPLLMCWGCCRCVIEIKYMFLPAWYIFFPGDLAHENIGLFRRMNNIETRIATYLWCLYDLYDPSASGEKKAVQEFPVMDIA